MDLKRHPGGRNAAAPRRVASARPRIRIFHVLEAIEGGTARHIVDVVQHVDADHVVVVPPERVGGLTDVRAFDAMEAAGARVELVDMRRSPTSACNGTALAKVYRLIRSTRPHVVHGHSSAGGAIARIAASGTGAARIYTPHGVFPALSALAVERALGRLTDMVIALSHAEANIIRHLRLVPAERLAVIPNGIDLQCPEPARVDLRRELGVAPTTPIVGTVARLVAQKAPTVFVRACALIARELPDARFVLVGDGPLVDEVDTTIARAGLSGRLLLLRGRTDGAHLMSQFDVFALASRYEAAPYAPLEAMRAGAAVIMTDVGSAREIVDDGTSGFVVHMDDADAIAAAAVRLLRDDALRERVTTAARTRLVERFDIASSAARLQDLYRWLAQGRSGFAATPGSVPLTIREPAPVPALSGAR